MERKEEEKKVNLGRLSEAAYSCLHRFVFNVI